MKVKTRFGESYIKNFDIGDLVEWSEWGKDINGKLTRYKNHGVLVNIIHKTLGERDVVFASVLPFDENQTIEGSITKIRKIKTN